MQTTEKVAEILFSQDDVTWKSIIMELIHAGTIDPWDIDIAVLTQRYIEVIEKLKEFDFNISGKALLAAAVLLHIKSNRLVGEDLAELDKIIAGPSDDEDFFDEDILATQGPRDEIQPLIPRLPQPRKRKVTVNDLMDALEKALEVKHRRVLKSIPGFDIIMPKKRPNVQLAIQNVYLKIKRYFLTGKELTFSQLIPSEAKEDKIATFIPLLHLTNRRKIDLDQKEHFGEIAIHLLSNETDISKEFADVEKEQHEA